MPVSGVDRVFEQRLAGLINAGERDVLVGGLRGVERESLRVTAEGTVSQRPHPRALGSALTNEHVTLDYSEALIELVTPPFRTNWELLQYLTDIHQFVYQRLGDELLWATSMPCRVNGDASIPIAQFGRSNLGRMKTIYREGLGARYGRLMQAISGVHFNYSFPEQFWPVLQDVLKRTTGGTDFISEQYFALLRNFRRHGWLVLYLFGVSPALCKSFIAGRDIAMPELGRGTVYEPHATSLRMSDLGYRNKGQAGVVVSANSLDEYIRDLTRAISTSHPDYQRIGVKVDGEYRQLNANWLQLENEYYSFIRPKRVIRPGEKPTSALRRAGVQYVEVRSLDVSAFDPVGVNQHKMRFLEAFLAYCVLASSPPIGAGERDELDQNHVIVARRGREPGLKLRLDGRSLGLAEWARRILDSMQGLCEMLDAGDPERPYTAALALQSGKLDDPARTPSARLLKELESTGQSFFDLALEVSRNHKQYFLELQPPNAARLAEFATEAEASLLEQERLEATDRIAFDVYLQQYFARP